MYIDFHPSEERFDKFSGIQSKIETSFAELGIHFIIFIQTIPEK